MTTKNEHIQILDKIVFNYLQIRHSNYCQQADLEDLKQEVLMRLGKIMPDHFESTRHFYNWCRKFTKMYCINAFRDYLTRLRHRPREVLTGNMDEEIIEKSSYIIFWQKECLQERMDKFSSWSQEINEEEMEVVNVLLENNSSATAVAKKMNLPVSTAQGLLKRMGLRTKKINQIKRYD